MNREIKDSDADGLLDEEEKKLGTNPNKKDSDNDGLADYEEVNVYGTDPNDPDTDKDGVSDGDEVKMGRNPRGRGKLKDLFIPYAGNDYKPQALHPQRIFFHALSAILVKVLVIAFVVIIPVGAWLTPDVLLEQAKKIIELTNKIRQSVGVQLLTENSSLTQAAYNKAEDMLLKQYFAHVGPDEKTVKNWLAGVNYKYAIAGENLAMGFSSAEEVVNGWVKSQTHYANLIDPDFSEIGVGMASGLYNNYDTTLVAQFFGAQNQPTAGPEIQKPDASEAVKNTEIRVEAPAILGSANETAVMGEKEEIIPLPLEAPIFISPAKGLLDGGSVKIKVFSPGAEKVAVYIDGEEIGGAVALAGGYADLAANLAEGPHSLKAVASRGEENKESEILSLMVDTIPPEIDQARTKLTVVEAAGQKDKVVQATAYLSSDTVLAEVVFSNYHMALSRDESEDNKWVGQTIIFNQDQDQVFNPVVLPSLSATDWAGNKTLSDISWENITPVKPSLLSQYFFLKKEQPKFVKALFDVSSIYYKIILGIVIIALLLNIFIEIKKQHPKIIASALGLIFLLVILIVL
ncbi:MAG: CAP domain-containing protein [Patescibacteria group bacterium]|nr:CAP domain-containing protein [Patescibacteria group bacterium]MDD5554414.1 CAP domain-containing protein [Patescibacteria group bacterium]